MNPLILLAFIPMIGWALGDFFIQRSTKKIGNIESLFFICLLSTVVLTPFVGGSIFTLTISQMGTLFSLSILIFIFAMLLFQAFKVGKLSVLESVVGLELPVTVGLSVLILGEVMSGIQIFLFALICFGIFLATIQKHHQKVYLEKGFYLALGAAGLSALTNFYIGVSSQEISPFITIWFTHLVLGIICILILFYERKFLTLFSNFRKYPKEITLESIADNIGWISYAYTVTVLPISLTVTISESYIILAALLGYWFNKEKLTTKQKFGSAITLVSVVILSFSV